jgi:phosphohistidine phosphatase
MKRFILFRHAKAEPEADGGDHARPLSPRGMEAARTMGRFLALAGQEPQRVLCSSSVRTRETLEEAKRAGEWECEEEVLDELYLAEPAAVLDVIRRQRGAARTLMVLGHEPTASELVRLFTGQGMPASHAPVDFPTAAMARIDLDIESWSDADFGLGQLVWLVPPKLAAALLDASDEG